MKLKHYFLAFLTSIIWGGNFIATKYGTEGFGVFGLTLIVVITVSIVLSPYLNLKSINHINIVKIALLYGIGFTACINFAISYTDSLPLIVIITQSVVPFGALFSYLYFGEKITKLEISGIIISIIGIIILVGIPSSFASFISIIAALFGSLCQAWQMALIKKHTSKMDTRNFLAYIHLLNIPLFIILAVIFDDLSLNTFKQASFIQWASALYTGIVSTVIGANLWLYLLKKHSVNTLLPFMLLVPLFGILFSTLCFSNKLTQELITGGILVIIGVAIIQLYHNSPRNVSKLK